MKDVKENLIARDTFDFCRCATELFLDIDTKDGWADDLQATLIAAGLTTMHKLVEPTPNSWLSVLTAYSALENNDDLKNLPTEKDTVKRYQTFMAYLRSCVAAYENAWYNPELLSGAGNLADKFDKFDKFTDKEND